MNLAAPNPFSSYTTFTLPKELSPNAKLAIYDLSGSLVKQMTSNQSGIIIWYGDDSQGRLLLPGLYVYIITDHKTSKRYSGKVNISNR